jgi:hypothetical protein
MHKWGEVEDRLHYEIQDWIRICVYANNWIIISYRVTYPGSESVCILFMRVGWCMHFQEMELSRYHAFGTR